MLSAENKSGHGLCVFRGEKTFATVLLVKLAAGFDLQTCRLRKPNKVGPCRQVWLVLLTRGENPRLLSKRVRDRQYMSKTVIFGATGHMGQAIARQLVAEGKPIHLAARDDEALAALATELGTSASPFDLTNPDTLTQAVADASTDGELAGLVWAVGSILLKPLGKLTASDFMSSYQTNVVGAALAVQAAQTALKAGKGSVVLFSSVAASQGFTNHAAISAAKAGVEGLAKALAAELSPDVRVNVIAPSLSQSKMAEPLLANEAMAKGLAQMHPLGRLGQAEDFSGLACLLLDSEKSGWMTGTVIAVDGGRGSLAVNARSR